MSILIAIDHGNYACKTPNFSFTSGLVELSGKTTIHETDIRANAIGYQLLGNHQLRRLTKMEG